jgi:hypothetical protein
MRMSEGWVRSENGKVKGSVERFSVETGPGE